MNTSDTLAIINSDLGSCAVDDSRPERAQLPEAGNLNLKSQEIEYEVHLPGQIEENLSGPSTRNLARNNREAIQSSDNSSMKAEVHLAEQTQENLSVKDEATEQKQIYAKCMTFFYVFALIIGVRMSYTWRAKNYFTFYSSLFFQFVVSSSIVITVFGHFVNGRYMSILEPLAITGLTLSCALKLYAFLTNWMNILSLVFAIRKYFRPNVFGRQAEIVKLSLRKTWSVLIGYSIGVMICGTIYAISPIIVYLKTNEIIPLMPIEIFFCDQSQTSGFVAANIIQFIIGVYGTIGTLFNGAVIIFIFRNYILQADLIAEDFQELDGMWSGINNISVQYKHEFLKNLCQKFQDMNNFLNLVKHVYETQFFIYFCGNYFSQIICLYDITQNEWIGGFGPLFGMFFEMMFYCYMGTQLSIVDDKRCFIIYNSNWNTYDLESQRMIQLLLHESQQPKELMLGVIGPLSMVTGITIVKSIYSYYTVLTELF